MEYLIIFAIVCMVAGPIFWMMPTPRQKRLATWRAYAMKQGLSVRVVDIPQSRRMVVRQEEPKQGAYYQYTFAKPKNKDEPFKYCYTRADIEPEWLDENVPAQASQLIELLAQYPLFVKAIDFHNGGIGFYWFEKGDRELIDKMAKDLAEIAEQL